MNKKSQSVSFALLFVAHHGRIHSYGNSFLWWLTTHQTMQHEPQRTVALKGTSSSRLSRNFQKLRSILNFQGLNNPLITGLSVACCFWRKVYNLYIRRIGMGMTIVNNESNFPSLHPHSEVKFFYPSPYLRSHPSFGIGVIWKRNMLYCTKATRVG